MSRISRWIYGLSVSILFAATTGATTVPSLTFEQLTDQSDMVVSGRVTRSWSDWDSHHKFIWTHYELAVTDSAKGSPGSTVVLSELGGLVGNQELTVAGTTSYAPGDRVVVFLQRMPNGYLRTTGWGQGKYIVDKTGRLRVDVSAPPAPSASAGTPLSTLAGLTIADIHTRVAARIAAQQRAGGNK
jgi:hypothetical protein